MIQLLRNCALFGAATFALGGAALAQPLPSSVAPETPLEAPPADSMLSGVTVSVPKVLHTTRDGVATFDVQLSVHVPYKDLDMKTPAGVAELDRRVKNAADYACGQLENMYPVGTPGAFRCSQQTIDAAQPQVTLARSN